MGEVAVLDPGAGALILWAIGWIVIFAIPSLGIYALFRFLRAYERRGAERSELSVLKERLLRVEEGTGDIGDRLDKLAEEQRFLTRLLRERPGARIDE
jgi:hypothetical protein